MSEAIRWTIKVSRQTDLDLRTFLGAQGMKKADLSKFFEDAERWRTLDRTVQTVKRRNRGISADELQVTIDNAVREVRKEMRKRAR